MKVIKKSDKDIKKEEAHGGSGSRKLYIADNEFGVIQGMTYGWLPVGNKYEWHNHENIDEIMYVLKGTGIVKDEDGITYYVLGSMTENINNDGIPDGVYFIVEFDGEKIDVIEKHIRL